VGFIFQTYPNILLLEVSLLVPGVSVSFPDPIDHTIKCGYFYAPLTASVADIG